jgi:hypothetical protein
MRCVVLHGGPVSLIALARALEYLTVLRLDPARSLTCDLAARDALLGLAGRLRQAALQGAPVDLSARQRPLCVAAVNAYLADKAEAEGHSTEAERDCLLDLLAGQTVADVVLVEALARDRGGTPPSEHTARKGRGRG